MPVRGCTLLHLAPGDLARVHGNHIIHQSWKTEAIPPAHQGHVRSWEMHHPDALHVLWTDDDNDRLVHDFYPELVDTYRALVLPVQRCDLVRLLYLHRYGGLYADLDYEAHMNVFRHLPSTDIAIVESPVLLNETMQNSLMFARHRNHPFWVSCTESISEIVTFINAPEMCYANRWGGCKLLEFFQNRMTKKIAHMIFTLYISGPAVLDKTLVRHRERGWTFDLLPKELWFIGNQNPGGIATHHQANCWVSIPKAIPEIIIAGVALLVTIMVLCVSLTVMVVRKKNPDLV